MYQVAQFAETRIDVLHTFIAEHPLGSLITLDASGTLQANTIPFVIDACAHAPGVLRGHVARANPVWRDTRFDTPALVMFHGPQGYISPSWYPSKRTSGKVVPTWNYAIVQARGTLRAIDDAAWLRAFVERLTNRFEATSVVPWQVSDAPADFVEQMLRAIVGIEIELTSLVGKLKMSQNRSAADREGVVAGLHELAERERDAHAAAMAEMIASVQRA